MHATHCVDGRLSSGDDCRSIRQIAFEQIIPDYVRNERKLCDRIYVLNFGEIIASGTPAEVRDNEAVIQAYLGTKSKAKS